MSIDNPNRTPLSYVVYQLPNETETEAICAAGLTIDEGDAVSFWLFSGNDISRSQRVVSVGLLMGAGQV